MATLSDKHGILLHCSIGAQYHVKYILDRLNVRENQYI